MYCLAFDRAHNVLLSRFTGMLVADDIRTLDEDVRRFVRDHGNVRGLLDFSGVIHVAVPESFFRRGPACPARPRPKRVRSRPSRAAISRC